MHHKTIAELSQELAAKNISSLELTKIYLARIRQHDEILNSFITVSEEKALENANQADQLRAQNKAGL